MEDVKNSWCLIAPFIWERKDLNLTEKCLLGRVWALSKGDMTCFASNEFLGEELGKSPITVSHTLTKLSKMGFIKIKMKRNQMTGKVEERDIHILITSPLAENGIKGSRIRHEGWSKSASIKESIKRDLKESTPLYKNKTYRGMESIQDTLKGYTDTEQLKKRALQKAKLASV